MQLDARHPQLNDARRHRAPEQVVPGQRLQLQPGVSAQILDVHLIFKLHLFLGMTIFLVFPFTRLVHVWSAPVWYIGRRGYQIVRSSRAPNGYAGSRPQIYPAE